MLDKNLYINENHPYLRPYICNGNPMESKIFLVGINPATSIYPSELNLETYINLLKDYQGFMELYEQIRLSHNKTKISRTRLGINSFLNWLSNEHKYPIIETDLYAYPTSNIRELENIPNNILKRSNDIFFRLLKIHTPEIIILYGNHTVNKFLYLSKERNLTLKVLTNATSILEIENCGVFAELKFNNKNIKILATRHFIYYGKKGTSFEKFRLNLGGILKEHNN